MAFFSFADFEIPRFDRHVFHLVRVKLMVKEKNNYIYILQLKLFIHIELLVLLYKS